MPNDMTIALTWMNKVVLIDWSVDREDHYQIPVNLVIAPRHYTDIKFIGIDICITL